MVPNSDAISLLPDYILELILVLLPLPDVVRTSVLSRRWGLLWTQIPKLVFDESFFKSVRDKTRLMPIICGIISRHRKPLLEFTFSLFGVSSLDIGQTGPIWEIMNHYYSKIDKEPNELLSIGELSLLKRLNFQCCTCKVPGGFGGFPMLTNLSFWKVDVDADDLSYIIKSCPLLDTLSIVDIPLCYYVIIIAPNLRVFHCDSFLMDILFEFTPKLENLIVSLDDSSSDEPEDIVVPFRRIPAIKYMELNGCFLKYLIQGDDNDMDHLTCLKLNDVNFKEKDIGQNVIRLIKHAPNLDTFFISASSCLPCIEASIEVWPIGDLSNVSLDELRYIWLENVTGKESEFELITLLLAKSPMLEVISILLHHETTDEEGLRLGEEFGRFQYASSQSSIKFYKCPCKN